MSDVSGFGKFVPGFEFLQNLAGQATSGMAQGLDKHLSSNLAHMPHLGNWVAPTFSVEDLEKRIGELKAVHFWLDQNAKALGATIQALEVQKMTLATLKTMNFSLGDVADALKVKTGTNSVPNPPAAAPSPAPTPFAGLEIPPRTYGTQAAPETAEEPEEAAAPPASGKKAAPRAARKTAAPAPAAAGGMVDPMQWWGALSQQFQSIAASAMKDVAMSSAAAGPAPAASPAAKPANRRPARAPAARQSKAAAAPSAPRKARKPQTVPTPSPAQGAARQPFLGGDWPMPTAFFPGLQPESGRASKVAAAATPKVGKASKTSQSRPAAKKAPPTATRRAASPAKARGTSGRR